jgi:hypothetical protein
MRAAAPPLALKTVRRSARLVQVEKRWKNDDKAWMATDGFGDNTTATNTTSPSSEVSLSLCPARALAQPAACGWAERCVRHLAC